MQMLIEVFSHYWLGLCMQSKCDFSLSAASTVDSESYLQLDATLYIRDTRTSVYFSTSKKKATSGFALNRGLTVPIDIATVLQTFLYTNLLRGALAAILLVESLATAGPTSSCVTLQHVKTDSYMPCCWHVQSYTV